jgi:hypothetical protein
MAEPIRARVTCITDLGSKLSVPAAIAILRSQLGRSDMNKIEMIRPLTFDELDSVAGGMMAFWTVGARELVITADANGSSVHWQDTPHPAPSMVPG